MVACAIWLSQKDIVQGVDLYLQVGAQETSTTATTYAQSELRGIAPDSDGILQCPLYMFIPYTNNGSATRSVTGDPNRINPALTILAGAVLAAEHFNARDPSVVPELANLPSSCDVRIDLNQSIVFDTISGGHAATRQFVNQVLASGTPPCAVAGPMSDFPAIELSTLALGYKIPIVVVKSNNERVVLDDFSPYTSMIFPDVIDMSLRTVQLLQLRQRTDFVSLVYTVSDTNILRREILAITLGNYNITHETHEVRLEKAQPLTTYGDEENNNGNVNQTLLQINARQAYDTLKSVKERGFRTIILCMDDPYAEFPPFVDAADELNMNNGDYFWMWFGVMDREYHFNSTDVRYHKLLEGSAELIPIEQFWLASRFKDYVDPFFLAWSQTTSATLVDRLNAMNPIAAGGVGYVYAEPDFFQAHPPDWGAGFMYDAVMSIGIGACLASQVNVTEISNSSSNNTTTTLLTGAAHLQGIRSVNFSGASGQVRFLNAQGRSGARVASSLNYVVGNVVGSLQHEGLVMNPTDLLMPNASDWTMLSPYIYADGTTAPPEYLRYPPEQNYISSGLKVFGLFLMSTVVLLGVMTIAWVLWHRQHRAVAAGQPTFLCTMAFGCIVEAWAIFARSFDESDGWSEDMLSGACVATTWLVSIGYIIVYGSLFSKLWRVNQVLAFSRRKIYAKQVAWPSAVLVMLAVIVLSVWTATDSLVWVRTELDEYTGESIGSCESEYMNIFASILLVILIIPTLLTLLMAWKTKDVSDEFSEAKWVWILIVVQIEVLLVAVPTIVILQDVSADGRYLGTVFVLWVLPMSTLVLIMTPKVMAYRRAIHGQPIIHLRGSELGTVRVSGLDGADIHSPPPSSTNRIESDHLEHSESMGMSSVRHIQLQNDPEPNETTQQEEKDKSEPAEAPTTTGTPFVDGADPHSKE